MQRLHENFVYCNVGRLRQRPHHGRRNVARVQPHVPVPAALRELSARALVGGAGWNFAVRVSGLHARDFDATSGAFFAQRLAHALYKELGARIPGALLRDCTRDAAQQLPHTPQGPERPSCPHQMYCNKNRCECYHSHCLAECESEGSHVHDVAAAALHHALQHRPDAVENTHAVDADFLFPLVFVQLRHARVVHDAGTVHQDANRQSQRSFSTSGAFFDLAAIGDIGCDAYSVHPMIALQRCSQGFNSIGTARRAADGSASSSQCFGYRFPDPAGGARYLLQKFTA